MTQDLNHLDDQLLRAQEVAKLFGVAESTIRRMTYRGELPYVRPTGGQAVRYRFGDMRKLIEERTCKASVEPEPRGGSSG